MVRGYALLRPMVTIKRMSVAVFGTPAVYAKKLRKEALLSCAKYLSLVGVSAAALYGYMVFDVNISPVSLVVPALVSAYASYKFSHFRVKYLKANVGVRAEVRVAKALVRCSPYALVNGSMLGFRGDIDHIVVGPCLVSVETKHGAGKVGINAYKKLTCGKKTFKGDPIEQAAKAASVVSRQAGLACNAVVVVTDGTSPPFRHAGVTVCSLRDLVSVLSSFPFAALSEPAAVKLAESLYKPS